MSEAPDDATANTEEIAREELIHRALLTKRCINEDNSQIKPEAFLRRRDDKGNLKEIGLSVDRSSRRAIVDFVMSFKKCFGVVGIYAGQIRDIGLEVVPETNPPNAPSHAEIIGWPDVSEVESDAREERLAGLLARNAQQLWKRD